MTRKAVELQCRTFTVETVNHCDDWLVGTITPPAAMQLDFAAIDHRTALSGLIRRRTIAAAAPIFLPSMPPVAENILQDFLQLVDVEKENVDGAIEFTRRYGVFRHDDLLLKREDGEKPPAAVRRIWTSTVDGGRMPFATPLRVLWNRARWLNALAELFMGLRERDAETVLHWCEGLRTLVKGADLSLASDPIQAGSVLFTTGVTDGLTDVRLAFFETGGKYIPALSSVCACDALYLELLFLASNSQRKLRRCINPKCREIFEPSRPDRVYCTDSCQKLAKRYRQHAREKAENTAPNGR